MDDPSRIHAILKDQTRRRIIEMLAEQEKVGFKEFRTALNIGVGTLYYHLDILSDYITQDKTRKYMLNEKGRLLHQSIKQGSIPPALNLDKIYQNRILHWLFLSPLLSRMNSSTKWLPLTALTLTIGSLGTALARLDPILLFYTPTTHSFELTAATFLFYWIGAYFLTDLLAYALYRRKGDDIHLLVCMGVAATPLAAYPYLHILLSLATPATIVTPILRGVLLALQVWSLILLTAAFSYGKGLRLERAVILSLCLLYANIAILIALGNLTLTA